MSEAAKLASIQAALDAHAEGCGDPVRAILLNPWDAEQLDWWEFRGLPIEADSDLPTDTIKIDCLATTVRDAIEDFHRTLQNDDDIAEAEARLTAKLDQLAAIMDEWWQPVRDPKWWEKVAKKEPELYRRFLRGEDWSLADHIRAEAAQFTSPEPAESPEDTFRAWQDAWDDMDSEDREMMLDALTDMPEDILEGIELVPRREEMPRVLRPPKEKVPLWHRFLRWLTRGWRPSPRPMRPANRSSVRTALDRYGRSGR